MSRYFPYNFKTKRVMDEETYINPSYHDGYTYGQASLIANDHARKWSHKYGFRKPAEFGVAIQVKPEDGIVVFQIKDAVFNTKIVGNKLFNADMLNKIANSGILTVYGVPNENGSADLYFFMGGKLPKRKFRNSYIMITDNILVPMHRIHPESWHYIPEQNATYIDPKLEYGDFLAETIMLLFPPKKSHQIKYKSLNRTAYLNKVVNAEVENVRKARVGERNNTLNESVFRVATLVAAFKDYMDIDCDDIKNKFRQAALENHLTELETQKTIRSAWDAGIQHPRKHFNTLSNYDVVFVDGRRKLLINNDYITDSAVCQEQKEENVEIIYQADIEQANVVSAEPQQPVEPYVPIELLIADEENRLSVEKYEYYDQPTVSEYPEIVDEDYDSTEYDDDDTIEAESFRTARVARRRDIEERRRERERSKRREPSKFDNMSLEDLKSIQYDTLDKEERVQAVDRLVDIVLEKVSLNKKGSWKQYLATLNEVRQAQEGGRFGRDFFDSN